MNGVKGVGGMPKEMLENEVIKKALDGLKDEIRQIFDIIDNQTIPAIENELPEEVRGIGVPMLKIQYANMLQTAFTDVYKEYITKCSTDFSNNMLFGKG